MEDKTLRKKWVKRITVVFLIMMMLLTFFSNTIMNRSLAQVSTEEIVSETPVIELTESDALVALEVEKEEEKQTLMEEYQDILLNEKSTIQEKNNAYENMQKINSSKTEEEKIQKIIEEKFKLKSVVKIKDDTISIVVNKADHDNIIANNIIRSVQELYKDEKYITVKFNK